MDFILNKRIEHVDLYKGIGILLMIMGHIGFGTVFDIIIHSFHMPMFFIISGYLFNKNNKISLTTYSKKKFKQLIIPYIIFGVIYIFLFLLIQKNPFIQIYDSSSLKSKIISFLLFNTDNMAITGVLWFLTSLFFASIIYYITINLNSKYKYLLIVVFSLIGMILPYWTRLPYGIDISLASIGFMHMGSIIKKNEKKLFNINILLVLLISIITIVLIMLNGYVNLRKGIYAFIPLTYINAIISSMIILYFSYHLILFNRIKIIKFINKRIIDIGANSITYLVFNEFLARIFDRAFTYIGIEPSIYKPISLILIVSEIYIINKILNYKYFRFMIGK